MPPACRCAPRGAGATERWPRPPRSALRQKRPCQGSEDLAAAGGDTLTHPALQAVTGSVTIGDAVDGGDTLRVRFPFLGAVGALRIDNALDLLSLQDSDGLGGNDATDSSFPALRLIRGELSIASNVSLIAVRLPVLSEVGTSLTISSNTSLNAISLPVMNTVGTSLTIATNAALSTLTLAPALNLGGVGSGNDLELQGNSLNIGCADEIRDLFCSLVPAPDVFLLREKNTPCFAGVEPVCN